MTGGTTGAGGAGAGAGGANCADGGTLHYKMMMMMMLPALFHLHDMDF